MRETFGQRAARECVKALDEIQAFDETARTQKMIDALAPVLDRLRAEDEDKRPEQGQGGA